MSDTLDTMNMMVALFIGGAMLIAVFLPKLLARFGPKLKFPPPKHPTRLDSKRPRRRKPRKDSIA